MIADMPTVQPFYVTGLPCSGTSWLSVALSDWRTVACLDHPLVRMDTYDPQAIMGLLDATKCLRAGISDPGLPLVAPELPALLPGPVVVIWRSPDEVADALHAYLGGDLETHTGGVLLLASRLEAFCRRHVDSGQLLYVNFEEGGQFEMSTMRGIWEHLLLGVPFQRRRIESLRHLRIDPDPDWLSEVSPVATMPVQS